MLGPERYGVLALMNLLTVSLAWSDLGMGIASTRFGAEAHARGDDEGEAAAIWGSLLLSALPAALAAAALAVAARPLLQGLHVPAPLQNEATLALRLAAIGIVARVATGVFNTPQLVRSRMRLHAGVTTAGSVVQIAGIPVALALGAGLGGAGAVIGGAAIATAVGQALVARRLLPRLASPRLEPRLLRRLARFGGALVVGSLAGSAADQRREALPHPPGLRRGARVLHRRLRACQPADRSSLGAVPGHATDVLEVPGERAIGRAGAHLR